MDTKYILTLLETKKISRVTVKKLLDLNYNNIESLEDVHNLLVTAKKLYSRIYLPSQSELKEGFEKATGILASISKVNIKMISFLDKDYPSRFREMEDPPLILYCKGNINSLHADDTIAIIGTRKPIEYSSESAIRIAKRVGLLGNTIISGLAVGCDTQAHLGAIESGTKTIAILPSSVHEIYPSINESLADRIISTGGCLISEYPPGSKMHNSNFIQRDRLQSGLSDAIIVVETKIDGGTMHAVKYALKQNKDVACLDSINFKDNNGTGNKFLIQEKNAHALKTLEDLYDFLEKIKKNKNNSLKMGLPKLNSSKQLSIFD